MGHYLRKIYKKLAFGFAKFSCTSRKTKLTAVVFMLFLGVLLPTHFAHASVLLTIGIVTAIGAAGFGIAKWIVGDVAGKALGALSVVLGALAGAAHYLLAIGSDLLASIFEHLYSPNFFDTEFVRAGWTTMRDFANMFFILWLVMIALATILNIKSYQAKKLLPKLIAVALLINFSLLFMMVMIDFSNASTMLFANIRCKDRAGNEISGPACIYAGMRFDKMEETVTPDIEEALKNQVGKYSKQVTSIFVNLFKLITSTVAAAAYWLLDIMLIVRMVALWLLMIVAPLAFVFWIVPFGEDWAQMWWSNFIKWCFYGLGVAFLLNIGVRIAVAFNAQNEFGQFFQSELKSNSGETESAFLSNLVYMMQYLILVIWMFITLKAAQGSASNAGDFVTKNVANWGKNKSKQLGRWSRRQTSGRAGRNASILGAKGAEWGLDKLGKVPGFKGVAGRGKAAVGEWRGKRQADKYDRERKRLRSLPKDELMKEAKNDNVEAMKIATERGWAKSKSQVPKKMAKKWYGKLSAYPEVQDKLAEDRPDAAGDKTKYDVDADIKVGIGNKNYGDHVTVPSNKWLSLKWEVVANDQGVEPDEAISDVMISVGGNAKKEIAGAQTMKNQSTDQTIEEYIKHKFNFTEDKDLTFQIKVELQGDNKPVFDTCRATFKGSSVTSGSGGGSGGTKTGKGSGKKRGQKKARTP